VAISDALPLEAAYRASHAQLWHEPKNP